MNSETVKRFRKRLYLEQNGLCIFCKCKTHFPKSGSRKQEDNYATLDHVIPSSEGGSNCISNLVISCFACNSVRRSTPFDEFMQIIAKYGTARNYSVACLPIREASRAQRKMQRIVELAIIGLWIEFAS